MLVAIDVGNSDVKLAVVGRGRILSVRRAPSRQRSGALDPDGLLADALGARDAGELARVARSLEGFALVSVVPAWTDAVAELAERTGRPLLEATHRSIPVSTAVRSPERVGSDRLLGAFTAVRLHGAPAIVVDLGTATTVDAVDAEGSFAGGAIAPGVALGVAALASGTALLRQVPLDIVPGGAIGRDTVEAIQAGAILGHLGLVDRLVALCAAELRPDGGRVPVVVTGGHAGAPWARRIAGVEVIDPHLLLKGLALLWAETGVAAAR